MVTGSINLSKCSPRKLFCIPYCLMSYYFSDDPVEKRKVKQAADCCRKILSHVNQALKESEDKQVEFFLLFSVAFGCFR